MKYSRYLISALIISIQVTATWADYTAPVEDITQSQSVPSADQPPANDTLDSPGQAYIENNNTPSTAVPVSAGNDGSLVESEDNNNKMSVKQRLARLEQQIANLTQMNLPEQTANLQQQLQQISGQVQVEEHDLQTMKDQLRQFYSDLSQQIKQIKTSNGLAKSEVTSEKSEVKTENKKSSDTLIKKQMTTTPAKTSVVLSENDQYKHAIQLLMTEKYDPAQTALLQYIKLYPHGEFLANAHYWLGEIYSRKNNLDEAQHQFSVVIEQYSKSSKVSYAQLKLALIHLKKGKIELAKNEFKKIKQQYPDSTIAQLASLQLQQIALKKSSTTSVEKNTAP